MLVERALKSNRNKISKFLSLRSGETVRTLEGHLPGLWTERLGKAGRAVNLWHLLRRRRGRYLHDAGRAGRRGGGRVKGFLQPAKANVERPLCYPFMFSLQVLIAREEESGRFRGITRLSWPALEDGNPDTSAGRCSPTLRRAPEFVSAGEDVLHAGSIPSVVSSPSVCSRLD